MNGSQSTRRSAARLATLLCVALAIAPSYGGSVERAGAPGGELRDRLKELVRQTRTASWTETLWERKGDEEQTVRSRCLWRADGAMRIEVEEGKGAGATLVRRGDEVSIRPPGIFGAFKLHRSVSDSLVKSLRGRDLRRAGVFAELAHVLAHWAEVGVAVAGEEVVLSYANAERLPTRMAIDLRTLAPQSIEARENGELVERLTFDDVRFDVPVEAEKLEP